MTPRSGAERIQTRDSEAFYDRWTELFLGGFGPVFQAGLLRTGHPLREDPERSVLALAERAGLDDSRRALDAGCGVCGPAVIIASRYPEISIHGVTPSGRQVEIARELIEAAGLADRVHPYQADYQHLPFRSESFDHVYFFESTGYSTHLDAALREAFRVLEPGGRLYIKDVFCRSGELSAEQLSQMRSFDELWGCHRSKTIEESVAELDRAGFEMISSEQIPDIGTDRFVGSHFMIDSHGKLGLSELGDAFLVPGLDPPIEFGEIRAVKP